MKISVIENFKTHPNRKRLWDAIRENPAVNLQVSFDYQPDAMVFAVEKDCACGFIHASDDKYGTNLAYSDEFKAMKVPFVCYSDGDIEIDRDHLDNLYILNLPLRCLESNLDGFLSDLTSSGIVRVQGLRKLLGIEPMQLFALCVLCQGFLSLEYCRSAVLGQKPVFGDDTLGRAFVKMGCDSVAPVLIEHLKCEIKKLVPDNCQNTSANERNPSDSHWWQIFDSKGDQLVEECRVEWESGRGADFAPVEHLLKLLNTSGRLDAKIVAAAYCSICDNWRE